jgi:hypothetical protein
VFTAALFCEQLLLPRVCVQMYCTSGFRCDVYSALRCLIAIVLAAVQMYLLQF